MIEVFRTDVKDRDQANKLVDRIHNVFTGYQANFDLEDCDKILRVKCATGLVQSALLIDLLRDLGCDAEILPGDNLPSGQLLMSSRNESFREF
jgi:hypothetical protein